MGWIFDCPNFGLSPPTVTLSIIIQRLKLLIYKDFMNINLTIYLQLRKMLNHFYDINRQYCLLIDLRDTFIRLFGYARVSTSQQSLEIQFKRLLLCQLLIDG